VCCIIAQDIRRNGSAALDLCWVSKLASGSLFLKVVQPLGYGGWGLIGRRSGCNGFLRLLASKLALA